MRLHFHLPDVCMIVPMADGCQSIALKWEVKAHAEFHQCMGKT
jgi:hypothetical protein